MRHLIKSVMIYPPGYVPPDWEVPEGYVPEGSIEDYDVAFSKEAPQVGQQFEYYGDTWTIAQVQTYQPLEQLETPTKHLHIAICTWDGSVPSRNHWHDGKAPLLVIPATVEGELLLNEWDAIAWKLVEREEWITPQEGWQIQNLQHFEPVGERLPGDFDRVVVAWSSSASNLSEESTLGDSPVSEAA